MIVALVVAAVPFALSSGVSEGLDGEPRDLSRLAWIESIRPVTLRVGESALMSVQVLIADGFHVQANPAGNEFLVPLELVLDPIEGARFGEPIYPAPEAHALNGADEALLTYHGVISIRVPVVASASAPAGEQRVTGRLTYQACDSSRCYVPALEPVTLSVIVTD